MTPPKLQPALLGGVVIGVLSALPVLQFCCCAWIVFGGALAAYLMQQNYPGRIGVGDGVLVGLLAGLFGAVVWAIVSIPLQLAIGPFQERMMQQAMENASDLPPEARAFFDGLQGGVMGGVAWFLSFMIMTCLSAVFGMIGGLFGALMFAKDVPPPPPPPSGPVFTPPTFTPSPPPPPPPLPGGEA